MTAAEAQAHLEALRRTYRAHLTDCRRRHWGILTDCTEIIRLRRALDTAQHLAGNTGQEAPRCET